MERKAYYRFPTEPVGAIFTCDAGVFQATHDGKGGRGEAGGQLPKGRADSPAGAGVVRGDGLGQSIIGRFNGTRPGI